MIIKKRPVISWLLNGDSKDYANGLFLSEVSIPINQTILGDHLTHLSSIRAINPQWGLPELVTPSFERVMMKSVPSFDKIMPELYKEFSKDDECGIIIKGKVTLVYGFGDEQLHIWFFLQDGHKSIFKFYSSSISVNGHTGVSIENTIIADDALFPMELEKRQEFIGSISNFVATYLAVKKYGEVETIVIPEGITKDIEGTPLEYVEKKKVINNSGQKVIVMDSRWFRKIVNDNDIQVRGFFKMQPRKNDDGEWYRTLIFIEPHIRHGYHRNAGISDSAE